MFQYCHLTLTQGQKWLNVTLLRPQQPGPWLMAGGIQWTGKWRLGGSSMIKDGSSDTTYTIGSSSPQEVKYWRYSMVRRALIFMESATMTGGSGGFGSTTQEEQEAMILNNAHFESSKVEPFDDSGTGTATIVIPSNIFRPNLPVTWEWVLQS